MSKLKVNSIVNRSDDGPPIINNGLTVPDSTSTNINSNVNFSGISTCTSLVAPNIVASTVTSGQFIGDGSNLSFAPITNASKIYALKQIFDQNPFRS